MRYSVGPHNRKYIEGYYFLLLQNNSKINTKKDDG